MTVAAFIACSITHGAPPVRQWVATGGVNSCLRGELPWTDTWRRSLAISPSGSLQLTAELRGIRHELGLALGIVGPEAGRAHRSGVEVEHGLIDLPGVRSQAKPLHGEDQEHAGAANGGIFLIFALLRAFESWLTTTQPVCPASSALPRRMPRKIDPSRFAHHLWTW